MAFPFAAALMGMGAAGSLASIFGGPNKIQGTGRMQRTVQAQMQAATDARQYFEAAGDVTSPLFRRTAAMEESRLRRAIAEGIATSQLAGRKARARGLTAGLRPEREDEARNLAMGKAFQQASEASAGLARNSLQNTGQGLLGISRAYGSAADTSMGLSQMETTNAQMPWMQLGQASNLLSLIGMGMGGGGQLNQLFGGGGGQMRSSGSSLPLGNFQTTPYFAGPQFSWRGGP